MKDERLPLATVCQRESDNFEGVPVFCGHSLSDHERGEEYDGQGCMGAIKIIRSTGPDPVDEAERCHCPGFVAGQS